MRQKPMILISVILNIILLFILITQLNSDVPKHLLTIPSEFSFENVNLIEKDKNYQLSYTVTFNETFPNEVKDIYYPEYLIDVIIYIDDYEIPIKMDNAIDIDTLLNNQSIEYDFEIPKNSLGIKEKKLFSSAATNENRIMNFAHFKIRRSDRDNSFFTSVIHKNGKI